LKKKAYFKRREFLFSFPGGGGFGVFQTPFEIFGDLRALTPFKGLGEGF